MNLGPFAPIVVALATIAFILTVVRKVRASRRASTRNLVSGVDADEKPVRRVFGSGGGAFSIGPGASGAIYDMLNQDKRKAIEIILEEKAEATDPERARGDLGQLEKPTPSGGPRGQVY